MAGRQPDTEIKLDVVQQNTTHPDNALQVCSYHRVLHLIHS